MKKKFLLAITAAAVSASSVTAFAAPKETKSCSVNSFDSFAYNYLIKSGLISDDCINLDEDLYNKLLSCENGDCCLEILFEMLGCGSQLPGAPDTPECPNIPNIPDFPDVPDTPEDPETPDTPEDPDIPDIPDIPDVPDEPQIPDAPEDGEVSSQESAYAAEVVRLVNIERAKEGLDALTVDTAVQSAAQVRAQETVMSFSHTRPDGRSCYTALDEAGATYSGAGENIAYGQETPEEVVDTWMNSPGHRANILNSSYTHIGVGCYDNGGTYYWSQFFTY